MKIFGREISFGAKAKALSPEGAAWLRGEESGGAGAVMTNAYQQVVWVYSAINVLAQSVAACPFRFSTGNDRQKETNRIEGGPLVDFYRQPHPQITGFEYWELRVIWLMLRGECFRVPIYEGRKLVRIAMIDPRHFRHIIDGNELIAWQYTGGTQDPVISQVFLPEEVWFEKLPNPFSFWRGMSPLSVASLSASTDFAAGAFMKGLMENNADTGVIVTTDQQLTTEQRENILSALRERKRKAGTADRPLLLWAGSKLEKPTISSADMQFLDNRRFTRAEICAAFGVPEEILTPTETAKYDVMSGARLNFIENRVAPLCARLESKEQAAVQAIDKRASGWFDIDALPVMQAARRSRWTTAKTGFDMGVPFNELNRVFDLGSKPLAWGDMGVLPFSLQPADQVVNAAPPEPATAPGKPAGDPVSNGLTWLRNARTSNLELRTLNLEQGKGRKGGHVCAPASPEYEAYLKPREKLLKSKVKRFWFEQTGRILSRLPEVLKEFKRLRIEHEDDEDEDKKAKFRWVWEPVSKTSRGLDELFDSVSEDGKIVKALKTVLIADLQDGGARLYGEINSPDNFSLAPKDAIEFLDKRKNSITGINQTTWDKLKASLQEGLQGGESQSALEDRVRVFFAGQDGRAEMIATTETNCATNSGMNIAMKQAGVERKGWKTSNLEGTRDTHIENEQLSDEQNGIPIDQVWPNGCAYPGDPNGDAAEVINCRCFGFAIVEREASP